MFVHHISFQGLMLFGLDIAKEINYFFGPEKYSSKSATDYISSLELYVAFKFEYDTYAALLLYLILRF